MLSLLKIPWRMEKTTSHSQIKATGEVRGAGLCVIRILLRAMPAVNFLFVPTVEACTCKFSCVQDKSRATEAATPSAKVTMCRA